MLNCSKVSEGQPVTSVGDKLIHEAENIFKEKGHLTDEILSALRFVYQTPLLPALDLTDNKAVTMVISPSGRKLYQVMGSSGKPYTCFLNSRYCSCPAYRYSVLLKEDHILVNNGSPTCIHIIYLCKHVLALRLSDAMGLTRTTNISDKELTNMIVQMD
ncbi:zinc finger SWIM domain-containing protein 7-like isoform X1 [Gigantopelta aegis]|uniref:zinc finger SWIM domain-containing protein 7-like isoform X1 n=1 Tax=Gigantopelta aegis TaxID=1735272 RepID=UPI001B88D2FD|nr:zinc finger SWIM domain-containing protein 7-like isoform X1 [Gigantopelta aegis]